jgi:hypothetical protein
MHQVRLRQFSYFLPFFNLLLTPNPFTQTASNCACFLCGKVPDRAARTVPFLLHSFTGPVLNPDLASLTSCLSTICGQPVDDALIVTAINATMLAHKLMHVPYACPTCVNSFTSTVRVNDFCRQLRNHPTVLSELGTLRVYFP